MYTKREAMLLPVLSPSLCLGTGVAYAVTHTLACILARVHLHTLDHTLACTVTLVPDCN